MNNNDYGIDSETMASLREAAIVTGITMHEVINAFYDLSRACSVLQEETAHESFVDFMESQEAAFIEYASWKKLIRGIEKSNWAARERMHKILITPGYKNYAGIKRYCGKTRRKDYSLRQESQAG